MSVILQRGDRIHLAVPEGADVSLISKFYEERGVAIGLIERTLSDISIPVIVAVFRDPPKPTPMDIMAVMPPGPRAH